MPRTLPPLLPLAALLLLPFLPTPARACPFCSMQGQTLANEVDGADMVLYGTLTNSNAAEQTTDLVLDAVVKKNDALDSLVKKADKLGDKRAVMLPKYLPPDLTGQDKFLVFCYVAGGKLDPYRGMAMKPDSHIVAYLLGAQELKEKKKTPGERLEFFFNYLDDPDPEISMDAFKEFANAPYADYQGMAKKLPPEKIAGWLRDPNTPGFRVGLYGSLLGHCGNKEDALLLRSLLEDPSHKLSSGIDGILAGYTMIDPKAGWEYTKGIMKDPSREFLMRYAALRATQFFHDFRPDLVDKKELAQGILPLLNQKDIADLAVEDLRKWGCSDLTDRVLGLQGTDAYKTIPIVRRSVLRFALSFPDVPADAAFVAAQRRADPQAVSDVEELLKLDQGK